jgi:hypothetical protein
MTRNGLSITTGLVHMFDFAYLLTRLRAPLAHFSHLTAVVDQFCIQRSSCQDSVHTIQGVVLVRRVNANPSKPAMSDDLPTLTAKFEFTTTMAKANTAQSKYPPGFGVGLG